MQQSHKEQKILSLVYIKLNINIHRTSITAIKNELSTNSKQGTAMDKS